MAAEGLRDAGDALGGLGVGVGHEAIDDALVRVRLRRDVEADRVELDAFLGELGDEGVGLELAADVLVEGLELGDVEARHHRVNADRQVRRPKLAQPSVRRAQLRIVAADAA